MENNDIAVCRQHDGREVWRLNRKLHREGGPAVIFPDDKQEWYIDGQRHKEDGSAVTEVDGSQERCRYGELLHREDGSALIFVFRRV
jgi:hypothetical protein